MEINGEVMEIESRWCLLNRAYDKAIIGFKERNNLIVKWAQYFSGRGLPTVLVCTRTLHCFILEGMLSKVIDPDLVDVLIGEHTPTQRNKCFAWFKETPGAILITPLVKEGVSINEIRAGVVCDYVADFEVANQIIGRFLRQKDTDNTAEIVWFNDYQHPIYRKGCRGLFHTLQRVYTKQGYRFLAAPVIDVLLAEG
jgi:superfamily II DNA or RNA helicase